LAVADELQCRLMLRVEPHHEGGAQSHPGLDFLDHGW
jgi:hypothetical protein